MTTTGGGTPVLRGPDVSAWQGAAIDLTYRVRLRPASTPSALVAALNRLEGVQNVELRR